MIDVREDFPLLKKHPELVYLDSACTSLKPTKVIEAEMLYYTDYGACVGRSAHKMARETTKRIEQAREKVAAFVNGDSEGLVWTKNATEAINLVAAAFDFSSRRKVITTVMEHHAALLPFMKLEEEGKIGLEILQCDGHGEISMEAWEKAIGNDTALVVTNCGTNTTGRSCDVAAITKLAHDHGALVCIDGAQGVPHHRTDMKKTGCDFLCFSGHKMLGPTGIGAMVTSRETLESLGRYIVGGGTVKTVSGKKADYLKDKERFEAGIQNYAGIFGMAAACDYLTAIGMEKVEAHEKALSGLMLKALLEAGAKAYGTVENKNTATWAFNFRKAKAHEVALMLDKDGIAVRSGFFCAQPAMEAMGAKEGAVRASAYIYNNPEDIRKFADSLKKLGVLYG